MKTRVLKIREHGFVAQYTLDGYKWASISEFLENELEAWVELANFAIETGMEATYTGVVVIS